MKVAIVHYWLLHNRGGEKVVEALCELFPQAELFTHVYDQSSFEAPIRNHSVNTTFIQKLPKANKLYQSYLPLMPLALEQLDLRGYDLVISSESGPAKGVITDPGTCHICYCHSPMRYVWDMYHDYLERTFPVKRLFMRPLVHYLRMWDYASAGRVDHFVSNSNFVAGRIRKHYRREATVINPPVETSSFSIGSKIEDFYLMVGQLVSYKRADLAVEAFNRSGKKLVVIGDGEQFLGINKLAGPNIKVMGRQPFAVIKDHFSRCKALIFPGVEDFGIVPLEAMASGRPVVAFRKGGALETVKEGVTGIFFSEQTPDALNGAVDRFETILDTFDPQVIRKHAMSFDKQVFKEKFQELVSGIMEKG
jgi:glycosyltransferase involved in cell wall biosynthesis